VPEPESLEQLRAAVGAQYTLRHEIGRGGMATVYLAEDTKHHRPVALKVLHPSLTNSLGPERFRREITLAARLQHPHILSVHDSGETSAGQLWFTMPYVEGESLRDRLRRDTQLPVDEAVRIACEVADALGYAHDHGIVHRDIKPENILLTRGHALVADFGIARALTPQPGTDTSLTEAGIAVGTPAYMSPEQASGDPSLDARTDVYSLGAVLYEMLAGEPPFTGATPQAIINKMMSGEAPSVRRARPSVPEVLDAAIRRALAPMPADRYPSAVAFGAALLNAERGTAPPPAQAPASVAHHRRVPLAALALGLGFFIGAGLLFAWRSRSGGAAADTTGPVRLAVLPFENVGDSADAYFADGLTDAVRGKLTSVPGLAVIAPASSRQYRNTTKTPQQIAQELGGVRYLLVGQVRWAKQPGGQSRVRVSPALVDVTTGTDKWEQPFDAPLTDVFEVQGDIAGRVVQAVGVALNGTTRETLTERPTENLAAYDAFLKGEAAAQGLSNGDPTALNRAIHQYEQAVALDSMFAPAWARLAQAYAILYFNVSPSPERADAARRAAERARTLAPNRPETHLGLGHYYFNVLSDRQRALTEFTTALPAGASSAELLTAAALVHQSLGQWDASLVSLKKAQALDPRDVTTARRLATTYQWLRRYAEATTAGDRLIALAPDNPQAIEIRAAIYLSTGDLASARRLIRDAPPSVDRAQLGAFFANFWDLYWVLDDATQRTVLTLGPDAFGGKAAWGTVGAEIALMRHDTVEARRRAEAARVAFGEILRATPQDGQSRVELALNLAILGRKAEAIREAERTVAQVPISADGYSGPYYQHVMVRTYLLAGEPDKALDALEPLLKVPYYLSPHWLAIDPTFDPLRANVRFQRLVAGQ
jgi:TolB-like protein/tRNA A-37 threonylcarbamoyl transferase component Bud32